MYKEEIEMIPTQHKESFSNKKKRTNQSHPQDTFNFLCSSLSAIS